MKKKIIIGISIVVVVIGVLAYGYFNINPEIQLNGEDKITLQYNDKYKEEGSKAKVLSKDITKEIKIKGDVDTSKVGTYEVEYTAKVGYLKRKKKVKRIIKVVDKEKPTITLVGEKTITITEGDTYKEPGYKAEDEYDGELTDKVVVDNKVNNKVVGTYQIIYTVKDSSDNEVSETRTVVVKKKVVPTAGPAPSGQGVAILMYHYFYDKNVKQTESINSNYMEIHDFEAQMKYLHDNDYYFPSWQEIADFVDGKIKLPKKSVVVTCDDGHSSFFNLAIPILNKYNVKATGFIITSKASAQKIPTYKSDNIIFESHTHNMHRAGCSGGRGGLFRCIDYNKGVVDLKESIRITGSSDAIAYPFGDITDNTLKITKASGFKIGVTIKYGKAKRGMDKLQLPRVRMNRGISLSSFKASL